MIQVNLLPDVKQELINARRTRATVVSISIIAMIASGGIVALLAVYVFAGQAVRGVVADSAIKTKFAELSKTGDLSNMLTVQNQLTKISETHAEKTISSRLFDVLSVIIPVAPNDVSLTSSQMNAEEGTLTIEGQSPTGFLAYEAFKKTIAATELNYYEDGNNDAIKVPLASDIIDGERSYGEDQDGRRVLRFSISFTYDEALFSQASKRMVVQGPERRNATDSFVAIPDSLFTVPANDEENK
ncbi:hypothetical protein H7142_00030 [Candidatus Saccharibacteria bacterium]|nr:hypothetical protein [Candidatus Saccharibacteria bacterium]